MTDKLDITSAVVLLQLKNCITVAQSERAELQKDMACVEGKIAATRDAIQIIELQLERNKKTEDL